MRENFWLTLPSEFSELRNKAIKQLVQFGSTYVCESAFSAMYVIKTDLRSRMTNENLETALRAATTSYEPNYTAILNGMRNLQFSQ